MNPYSVQNDDYDFGGYNYLNGHLDVIVVAVMMNSYFSFNK